MLICIKTNKGEKISLVLKNGSILETNQKKIYHPF